MKSLRWRKIANTDWFIVGIAALIGVIVFLVTFGYQVVVPTNVNWLLAGGDLSQHYIGWEFYRNSAWVFPFGVASDLAYPHGLAITFMDSLPLFAIPAKVFSGLLPEHFQYFGLWGLLSYGTLGAFTGLTVRRWTPSIWLVLLAVLFVCFSPIVFQRMFAHTALAGHWIILAGIYAVIAGQKWRFKKNIILWSALLSLSVLIHPYFLAMNFFTLLVAVVLQYKSVLRAGIQIGVPVVVGLIMTWLIGGFTFSTISGQRFGGAGYDIVAPFLANGWSVFGVLSASTRFETFYYVGLGGFLLVVMAIILLAVHRVEMLRVIRKHRNKAWAIIIILIVMMVVSLGPTIKFAGVQLFHYDVPLAIEKIWAIFRITARIAWPLWYGLLVASLFIVIKFTKPRWILSIIAMVTLLQIIDIGASQQLRQKHDRLTNVAATRFETTLRDPAWSELAKKHKHVVYLGDLYDSNFINIAQYSAGNKLTLNTGYFARKPTKEIERTVTQARNELRDGSLKPDTIYIYDRPYESAKGFQERKIDGYYVTVR